MCVTTIYNASSDFTSAREKKRKRLPTLSLGFRFDSGVQKSAGLHFTRIIFHLSDFHSPTEEGPYTWELDTEYRDYQWWLARLDDGPWEIVSWGY